MQLRGILVALPIVAAVLVMTFDWNWLRGPIAREVSRATGRSFAINGDLAVELSLRPRVVANGVVMGNAPWSREPVMADIPSVAFTVDLLDLLAGKLVFPEIALSQPRLAFEVNRSGEANWIFSAPDKDKSAHLPSVDLVTIDQGTATYRDPRDGTDMALEVRTLDPGTVTNGFGLALQGKGRYKGQPATLHARGGALLHLRNSGEAYPIKANGEVGATRFSVSGLLLDPLHFSGEQLDFSIEGADLAALFPIIGVPLPPTPPYKLAGFLDHADHLWRFHRIKGTFGHSDLGGEFSVDHSVRPQKITANLVSKNLVLRDLEGFIGAGGAARARVAPGKVLPDEPFNFEKLRSADVDARFRGANVVTANLPLDNMDAHLVVRGGVVKLEPLAFGVAGGKLVSTIEMDARQPRMATDAAITASGLNLARMFPNSRLGAGDTGTIGGRAQLHGNGNSVAQMLGSAGGDAALIMEGGTVGELALRMSNLDIANSLLVMLGGDRQVPVRCMVGVFHATGGKFKVDALVLDTAKVNMTGSGTVDFADESLHLRLVSQSKGFSLASLRGPIAVTGSFASPVLKPEIGGAAMRGGLALALGIATAGVGALIPLLDFGHAGDSNCAALIGEARTSTRIPGASHAHAVPTE